MNEWWLISILLLMIFGSSALIIYPLRHNKFICLLVTVIEWTIILSGYYYWGGFASWQQYIHQTNSQKVAEQLLKTVKSPQELIDKLRAKLDDTPKSAKGWYLLGRLYSNQSDWQHASSAFAKAHRFKPDDEQYTVNYAHGLWQLNAQQFNPEIRDLFKSLLSHNPNQADALAMLAMDSFMNHRYEDAISYWQRLLKLAPEQSEEADAIRQAIAKAQQQLVSK